MKINFFTPLPPAPTDVARCVERLLPALAERAEVTLWTDQPDVDRSVSKLCAVRRYEGSFEDWRPLSYADFNLYNVGNDGRFHSAIMDVAQVCPGVVVLHDVCVHELLVATLERDARLGERYMALMEAFGPEAVAAARGVLKGEVRICDIAPKFPMTDWALRGALGVVSHNAAALRAAVPNRKVPLLDVPLPWLPVAQMAPARAHERGSGRLEMVICGFLNSESRRLCQVLDAMAKFPRRNDLRLNIAGTVSDPRRLALDIERRGLSRCVRVHGFLSERALGRLLEKSHMAINLRWPSVGEASGAQLRFWNHSLPTLVTRTGWYAQQPEDCVLFVDPAREEADLHRHWDAALDHYDVLTRVGMNGHRRLEERHSAETFADALIGFLPSVERYRSRAFVTPLAEHAGHVLGATGLPEGVRCRVANSVAQALGDIAGLDREGA